MTTIQLPTEFKEFIQLLDSHGVEYLIIGGYAIGFFGYPRATGDLDVWVAIHPNNQTKLLQAIKEFGLHIKLNKNEQLLHKGEFLRIGNPPLRIELLSEISGVNFESCYKRKIISEIDGIKLHIISKEDLKKNKRAAGRHKDLNDLENLN